MGPWELQISSWCIVLTIRNVHTTLCRRKGLLLHFDADLGIWKKPCKHWKFCKLLRMIIMVIPFKAKIWNLCIVLLIIIQWTICTCEHTQNNRKIWFSSICAWNTWHYLPMRTTEEMDALNILFCQEKRWFWAIFTRKSTWFLKVDNL